MTSFHDFAFFPNSISKLIKYAEAGNLEKLHDLLGRGVDVNVKSGHGNTALAWASNSGHLEVVRALLNDEGVDVNIKDDAGATALYYASYMGHVEVVRALLNHEGVDVNIMDYDGCTALILAIEKGHLEVVRALLKHEAVDVNIKDCDGTTALISACLGGHSEVVSALLNHHRVDVNIKNNDGRTAFDLARMYGKLNVVCLLEERMERENLLEEKNPAGSDATRNQDRSKRLKMINTASTNPVHVHLQCSYGKTALHLASQNDGLEEIVRKLNQQNKVLDVNIMDNDGETALIVASKKGHLDVVRALLDHDDVDVNVQNKDGDEGLDVARNSNNYDVAHLLEEHMRVDR